MLCPAGVNPGVIKKTDRLISSQPQLPLLSATGSNIAAIGGHKGGVGYEMALEKLIDEVDSLDYIVFCRINVSVVRAAV